MSAIDRFKTVSGQSYIGGRIRPSDGNNARKVIDPATGEINGEVVMSGDKDIQEATAGAGQAQKQWAKTNGLTRADQLHKVAANLREMRPLLAEAMTRDMGKPFKESMDEVEWSATAFDYYAEIGRSDNGRIIGPVIDGQKHMVTKHPLGTVLIVMAFNYPYTLFAWEASAALATGNAVILKPSEQTTLCSMLMIQALSHLPVGLVQCLPGDGEVGKKLVADPDIHCVAFTGSVPAGVAVAKACAETHKRTLIEASGNDPFIVMPSAPLDIAARAAVFSGYINCGQICARAERFFVHDSIYDSFVDKVTEITKTLRVGNGLGKVDLGPMVSDKERSRYEALVNKTVEQGAVLRTGNDRPSGMSEGFFVNPTVFSDITTDMDIMNTESFGPVIPACRVKDLDEAIERANQSQYALGSVIYTTELSETYRAIEEIEAGMTWVNAPLLDNDAGPFGGWKMSGTGSQLGAEGLEQFRKSKMVMIEPHCTNHDFWWYPYSDEESYMA